MIDYEFKCPTCKLVFTEAHESDSEKISRCPKCGVLADRVWSAHVGHIDWVNGGWHGDEVNLGLGKHFKSARERENYAKSLGLEKVKDG